MVRRSDSDDIEYTPPAEHRQESRVSIGHSRSEWRWKLQEYHWRCGYCGIKSLDTPEKYLERDHIVPVIAGGTDQITNIVPACHLCNQVKGQLRPGISVTKPHPRRRFLTCKQMKPLQRLAHYGTTNC